MSNVVKFGNGTLPSVSSLSTALRSIDIDVGAGGVALLKMDKGGHWVYGADQTEVEDDAEWAVNPFSFVHGFIAWGDGDVLAEKMAPVNQPTPELGAPPPGAKKGWEKQVGLSLNCLTGEDEGLEVRYSTTSVGGKKAVQAIAAAIAAQVEVDANKPVAIVRLGKDSYQHKSYGKIYTPVFEVLRWVDVNGTDGKAPAEAAPGAPAPAETGRRRRSV
jgi:hypothetical protein